MGHFKAYKKGKECLITYKGKKSILLYFNDDNLHQTTVQSWVEYVLGSLNFVEDNLTNLELVDPTIALSTLHPYSNGITLIEDD